MSHYDEAEKLNAEQQRQLRDRLESIGPGWHLSFVGWGGGALRAERGGTHRYEQCSLTSAGLLVAVEEAEARITSGQLDNTVPITTGISST